MCKLALCAYMFCFISRVLSFRYYQLQSNHLPTAKRSYDILNWMGFAGKLVVKYSTNSTIANNYSLK